ncbi:hypothetical protein [Streptomyces platensis]|uniref:hypothetical protein n=1 Tax=Streptomyces platensis TaxID=58346 RepID=UPI00331CA9BA
MAITAMIIIGVGVLTFGFSALGDTASVTHLWADGGFAPHGAWQSLIALQSVVFAYAGVELIGLTAGEAENRMRAGLLPATDFRMPGAPVTNWVALASLLFVVAMMALSSDTRRGLYVWAVWFIALTIGYRAAQRRQRQSPRTQQ